MNKFKLATLGAIFLTAGLAGPALGGEITGNGKWIAGGEDEPLKGKSACAYSGREDDPESGEFKGPIAQSWGQYTKEFRDFLTSIGFNPGEACNPSKADD